MLYDPKWEVQTKPDMFSLAGLIAWLETQDLDTKYTYDDPRACLICRYFGAMGFKRVSCDSHGWDAIGRPDGPLPLHFNTVAHGDCGGTYRAALAVARVPTRVSDDRYVPVWEVEEHHERPKHCARNSNVGRIA